MATITGSWVETMVPARLSVMSVAAVRERAPQPFSGLKMMMGTVVMVMVIMMMITMVVRVGGWRNDSPAPWDAGGEIPQLPGMLAEYFPSSLGRWRSPL